MIASYAYDSAGRRISRALSSGLTTHYGGGTPEKPAGTVYIGFCEKGGQPLAIRKDFPTDRETFKHLTMQHALMLLLRRLREG